jgi:hypothetical protein
LARIKQRPAPSRNGFKPDLRSSLWHRPACPPARAAPRLRAKAGGDPLDLAALTEATFARARAAYGGQAQSTRVVKLLEDALGTDLRAPGFPERL